LIWSQNTGLSFFSFLISLIKIFRVEAEGQGHPHFDVKALLPSRRTLARDALNAERDLHETEDYRSFIASLKSNGAITLDLAKRRRDFFVVTGSAISKDL